MTTRPPVTSPAEKRIAADLEALAIPVATIVPLPDNPRRGDVQAVARSLAAFGQRKPIVCRRSDRTVLAGNHTLAAAVSLGWDEIAVVWTEDDAVSGAAFALADNRTGELGSYDDVALAHMIESVRTADAALFAATSWEGDDLAALLGRVDALTPRSVLTDPDAVPDVPAVPVTVSGDVWLLGPHRLVCGDACDPAVYGRLLEGGLADMVWTDPPYGVAYEGGQNPDSNVPRERLSGDLDEALYTRSLPCIARFSQPSAPLYVWFAGSHGAPVYAAVEAAGYRINALLIWHKLDAHYGAFMARYMQKHEPLLYAVRDPAPWYGPSNEVTVWEHPQPFRNELHPTQKPVALAVRPLANSSRFDDVVLDPFAGSGTLLIACEQLGRRARLVELDPSYCDVICARYQAHTGTVPILEATGVPHDFGADG